MARNFWKDKRETCRRFSVNVSTVISDFLHSPRVDSESNLGSTVASDASTHGSIRTTPTKGISTLHTLKSLKIIGLKFIAVIK